MQRILMLCHYFPPASGGGVQRSAKFVRYLPRHGWEPVVVCSQPTPRIRQDPASLAELPPFVRVCRLPDLTPDGVAWRLQPAAERLLRGLSFGHAAKPLSELPCRGLARLLRPLYRPDLGMGFLRAGFAPVVDLARRLRVDAVYATSLPMSSLLLGLAVKREAGVPLICDLRDPLVGDALWGGMPEWDHHARRQVERRVVAGADRIISAYPTATEDLARRYPAVPRDRFGTILNGFDPTDIPPLPPKEAGDGVLRITHVGNIHGDRNAAALLKACGQLAAAHPDIRDRLSVAFYGSYPLTPALLDEFGASACVDLCGRVPHREVRRLFRQSDILLLPVMREARFTVPAKLYEYLGSRRPVLMLGPADSPPGRIILQLDAGWVFDAEDVDGVKHWLEDMLERKLSGTIGTAVEADLSPYVHHTHSKQLS